MRRERPRESFGGCPGPWVRKKDQLQKGTSKRGLVVGILDHIGISPIE